jgi:hypothetical protein
MKATVGQALNFIRCSEEPDDNRMAGAWQAFIQALQAGAVATAHVQSFCQDVLWREIVSLRAAMAYNASVHEPWQVCGEFGRTKHLRQILGLHEMASGVSLQVQSAVTMCLYHRFGMDLVDETVDAELQLYRSWRPRA